MHYPDMTLARSIEDAEAEYLAARVAALCVIRGNPYQSAQKQIGTLRGFLVQASASPMLNRFTGITDTSDKDAWTAFLTWFSDHGKPAAIPLISAGTKAAMEIHGTACQKIRGWTQIQLIGESRLASKNTADHPEIEQLSLADAEEFGQIHAQGFHTKPDAAKVNMASFVGLLGNDQFRAFGVREKQKIVAVGALFLASNGIAYLGIAATLRSARGNGYHAALINQRIDIAKRLGYRQVAATALKTSQSRRNLERSGLNPSHTQELFSVCG